LGLVEPAATGLLLLVFGVLIIFSVLFSRALDRAGVPVVLLFLFLGMLGGSEGIGGVGFDNYELAFRLGTVALILILFDGGLNTAQSAIRRSFAPAGILATVGVALTAGLVALMARAFGLDWPVALLIGAIVSSTDAAAVFAVLRGGSLRVKEPSRSVLEVESCVNDPMAVILTITIVEVLAGTTPLSWWLCAAVPAQLAIGTVVGAAVGALGRVCLNRIRPSTGGLYPVATFAIALLAFGSATLVYGSGFLAVFVAGAVLGNGPLPYRRGLTRVHDALAWFGQVSMFLMLGLLVFPSRLLDVAGVGLALGILLALVARPLAVTLCMLPFRWKPAPLAYTAFVGIRGAVPIILATIPVMAGIPDASRVFDTVFFIVVVSAIVPGALIRPITRRLGLELPHARQPAAALEMHSLRTLDGDVQIYAIHRSVAACGATIRDLEFPEHASVLLIVRGQELIPAKGRTRFEEGDFVYIFCRREDEANVGLIFGQPLDT